LSRQRSRRNEKPKKPLARRLARAAAWIVLGWTGLTVLAVLPLRWIDPPISSFMIRAVAEGHDLQRGWADWKDISPAMPIAAVAAEDQRFPFHRGFDVRAIHSALTREPGRSRGASTISQQVAKNLWLWPGRSWLRKGLEAWLTAWMELLWPKRRILEVYLNVAEFGPGVFGVQAAAGRYFGKPARDLTEQESSLLAAILPAPKRMNPTRPSDYVHRRAKWIREQARQLGGPAYLAGL
jgi:monofunctional biosynthetic peptidoglycan transglycosylase